MTKKTGTSHLLSQSKGFSLIELMVTVSLASILTGIGVVNLRAMVGASTNAAFEVTSYLKQVRAKAIATTSAYIVRPIDSGTLMSEVSTNCTSLTRTADNQLLRKLPNGSYLDSTTWSFCFTSKGSSTSNVIISLSDSTNSTQRVEVLLGGAVRVL